MPLIRALTLLMAVLTSTSAHARKLQKYIVQRGDTCWNIAERFIGEGKRYTVIHKHNKLGPPPHLLQPGTQLLLDAAPAPGKVAWLHNNVKAKGPRAPYWQRARRNQSLWRLYKVNTGNGASAEIAFIDRSKLRLRERALLVIFGSARRSHLRVSKQREVRLEQGVVRGGLAALDKRAKLTVKTPAATVELRSRDTQIAVDKRKRSSISVFDGYAMVAARGRTVKVPTNHGVTVARGQRPPKPRRLLGAPRWAGGTRAMKVVLPGELARFEASWGAVSGAKRYHFVLANNKQLRAPLAEVTMGAGIKRFRAERLKPGTYWARVQAVDDSGLSSRSSQSLMLRVVTLRSSRRLLRDKRGRIQVVGAAWIAADGFTVSVGSTFSAKPVLVKGRGRVRVGVMGQGFPAKFVTLHVIGIKASFAIRDRVIDGGGKTYVTVVASLDNGKATFVPGLTVNCGDGALPIKALGAGTYRATLHAPPQAAASMLACHVYWLGGKLGRTQVLIRYNEKAAKAYAKLVREGKAPPQRPRQRYRYAKPAAPDSIAAASRGDLDPDVDGVPNPQDKCPYEPEDHDGFQDKDGCPDPDNDHDGIPDAVDKCPLQPETVNGIKDDDGCPDEGVGKAKLVKGEVSISEKVYFASGRDTISPRSMSLLSQVARVLKANWQVRKLRIEGHTDSQGDKELNVDLSQRRAEQVKRVLVKNGIAAHRLVAVGFGPTKPVKSNKSAAGRAANRRVRFVVIKTAGAKR
ncbi:MAG: OmpA family protein [Myxococcales bacterium]|nr:OmpA family protein [Myxococcales bacterium]